LRYFKEWSFKHPTASNFKRIVERESGIELDWYFDYFVNTTKTIDYAISEFSSTKNGSRILLNKGEMPMPIELEVVLTNGDHLLYYIPTVLMRGKKEIEATTKQLEDWAWTNPTYSIFLKHKVSDIVSINLHPKGSIADVELLNDYLIIPTKWNWDKYDLRLEIVEKKYITGFFAGVRKEKILNLIKVNK
jgi:hypothetical protein